MIHSGATILGCQGLELSASERSFFRSADPFGFIVFNRNLETPEQIRRLCDDLRDSVGRDAPILIDQEGGRVQRLRPPLATEWLPALEEVQRAGANAAQVMHLRFAIIAAELRALGIDANCAPLGDIATPETHAVLLNRCYGETRDTVASVARAVMNALLGGGVLPVLKHIPGHGRANLDSHLDLPRVDASAQTLHSEDFAVFTALNDCPMGMTAHITYSALDDCPATLSPKLINIIRQDIDFDGLLMTDDISMKALSGTLSELSRLSLDAGCDIVLHCNGNMDEMEDVVAAAGRLENQSATRAQRALDSRKTPEPVDKSTLAAQLEALVSSGA